MKLVPEWKRCLRMFSVQAMILAGAVQGAWASLPDEMKATVSDDWLRYGTIALMILGVIGRLVVQSGVGEERP